MKKIKGIKIVFEDENGQSDVEFNSKFKCGFQANIGIKSFKIDNILTEKLNGIETFIYVDAPDPIYDEILSEINKIIERVINS